MAGSSSGSAGSAARKGPAKKAAARKKPGQKAPAENAPAENAPAQQAPEGPAARSPDTTAPPKTSPANKVPAKKAPPAKVSAAKAPTGSEQGASARTRPPGAEAAGALVVRAGEDPWSTEELAEVHTELDVDVVRLTGEITEAETDLAELLRDFGDGAGEDQADAGTKTFEREHEMSLANNTREMLQQSMRALGRIDDGTYGICENCGNPIGKARLQAFPRATLCMTCKQREERR